jgi:hypothetical protein
MIHPIWLREFRVAKRKAEIQQPASAPPVVARPARTIDGYDSMIAALRKSAFGILFLAIPFKSHCLLNGSLSFSRGWHRPVGAS